MSIIEDLDEEVSAKIERLQDGLNSLGDLKGNQRYQELKRLNALFKSASDEYKGYSYELLELNRDQYEEYFEKGKQYKEQLDFIKNSISAAKSPENTEKPTYDEMMKEANDIQEDDKTRVKGMIKTVANMEESGKNTLGELRQQGEGINRANVAMDQLDDEITLARRELR
jgi:vacuolar-type H+-ATPase subunit I/STV1